MGSVASHQVKHLAHLSNPAKRVVLDRIDRAVNAGTAVIPATRIGPGEEH